MSEQPRYDRPQAEVILPQLRAEPATGTGRTYYGRPMIKAPHWRWFIPLYFFIGGVAGGAAIIGSLARFAGGERHRATVRHARYLALALALLSPVLLILDLGRPKRFANMLRLVKVSSPLSLGTWILMGFGLTSGALTARQLADDGRLPHALTRLVPERLLTLAHGALGLGMGGYTGALLAATAVPLWSAAGVLLAPLFVAASLLSGASALVLMGLRGSGEARADLRAIETVASLAQVGLIVAEERFVPEAIGKPLREGRWGCLFRRGTVAGGLATPLALRLLARLSGPRLERPLSALAALLALLGVLAERFAVVEAGKVSAGDVRAYQALTAGTPGQARGTPAEQAARTAGAVAYQPGMAARDTLLGDVARHWSRLREDA